MTKELDIFKSLPWKDKIEYIIWFYQGMIGKTENPTYIASFQDKIKRVKWYEENQNNTDSLITMYEHIMQAREKTKQKKLDATKKTIEEQKQKLARIQADKDQQDPDEYLADSLLQI